MKVSSFNQLLPVSSYNSLVFLEYTSVKIVLYVYKIIILFPYMRTPGVGTYWLYL
jgi:hypothetical protein